MEQAFPDPIFRAYVLQHFDTDGDGRISKEEALAVTSIDICKKDYYETEVPDEEKIASLEGVQYFTNLTVLDCSHNRLTNLDMSQNAVLENLRCDNNRLTSLDISQNTALVHLRCSNNQLTSLDVSQNAVLESLRCNDNQLTSLDVSQNTALVYLCCNDNQLTSLNISQNTELELLSYNDNQLTSLDISQNTKLEHLWCNNLPMTSQIKLFDYIVCRQLKQESESQDNINTEHGTGYISDKTTTEYTD